MKAGGGRVAAIEILLNSPLISDLILKGETNMIKEMMAKFTELGMQTFDQALFDLAESGRITQEHALRNADSINELRLRFKLKSKSQEKSGLVDQLSLHEEPKQDEKSEEVQNIQIAANAVNNKPAQVAISV